MYLNYLALAKLLKAPDDFGIVWPTLPNVKQVEQVATGSQIDLALAAKLAKMDLKDLYQLNPGFNRWATPPNGDYKLLLPLDKADQDLNLNLLRRQRKTDSIGHDIK